MRKDNLLAYIAYWEDAAARSKLNIPNKSYHEIYDWLESHNISRDAAINLMHDVEIAIQVNREDEDKVDDLWEIYRALTIYVNPYGEWDD